MFNRFLILILMGAISGLPLPTFSQHLETIPIAHFSPQLAFPDVEINKNDSVTLEIHVGSPDNEVSNLTGFEILLTLGSTAKLPALEDIDLGHSWLQDEADLMDLSSIDVEGKTVKLVALKADGAERNGFGELVRITLVSDTDGITPDQLVRELAGGLVVVDNLETKRHIHPSEFTVFPNPATDRFSLQGLEPGEPFTVIDLKGSIWKKGHADEQGRKSIPVVTWPRGMYFLIMENGQRRKLDIH